MHVGRAFVCLDLFPKEKSAICAERLPARFAARRLLAAKSLNQLVVYGRKSEVRLSRHSRCAFQLRLRSK
ncbi:protein of unknown function [Methylocella tundrae]|uniref:Uncharacterized protein n=1 Tax=Methylocella tundrae TaxID=227605 RepID=A0A4U8YWG9_METTU|nr:protein of unknown function [Methylocella tundrae]